MLWDEPGGDTVETLLMAGDCVMSAVNAAEVAGRLVERGATAGRVDQIFDELGIEIASFDRLAAIQTGVLQPLTRAVGLSLGDRAALALARSLGSPAYTADRVWLGVDVGTDVHLIRPTAAP
jgi:PIN domain nuclease of toxin-antitoxin system